MELKTYFAQDASGNIMPGATVTVYEAGTATLATGLQDESGSPLSNPFTADSSAKVAFYAPDGLYDITVVGNGRTVTIRAQFVSVDGASVLRDDLAATGGAALVGADDGASGSLWTTVAGFIAFLLSSLGASVIGFIQSGAGVVARTAQDKLRETVSVKDFGAVGDGVTSDDGAVQLAINYINSLGGGTVVFPPGGDYYLNAQITLCDNLVMWGYGARLKLGSAWAGINKPLFKNFSGTEYTAPGTRVASKNISFLGFEVDGQDTGIAGALIPNADMHGAIICCGGWGENTGVDGLTVRDCNMYSFAGAGVMVWRSSGVNISDNSFTNFFANATLSIGSAIDCHDVSKAVISSNRINHAASGKSWHGMVVLDWDVGSSNVVISSNVIADMNGGDGISCEANDAAGVNMNGCVITGNVVENCIGDGVHIQGCVDVIASDNVLRTSSAIMGGIAISCSNTTKLIVDANSIKGNYITGVFTNGGNLKSASITNNTIEGMVYGDGTYQGDGIFIYDTPVDVEHQIQISGNRIKNVDGCGIYSAPKAIVTDNHLYNFARSASGTRKFGILAYGLVNANNVYGVSANAEWGVYVGDGVTARCNIVDGTFVSGKYLADSRKGYVSSTNFLNYGKLESDVSTQNLYVWATAAPSGGVWMVGDIAYNTNPGAGGNIGWVCTSGGPSSVWKTFGAIGA